MMRRFSISNKFSHLSIHHAEDFTHYLFERARGYSNSLTDYFNVIPGAIVDTKGVLLKTKPDFVREFGDESLPFLKPLVEPGDVLPYYTLPESDQKLSLINVAAGASGLDRVPRLYEYLRAHHEELQMAHDPIISPACNYVRLKQPTFRFDDHALKICVPRIIPEMPGARICRFGLDELRRYVLDDMVALVPKKDTNEHLVMYSLAILNSMVAEVWIAKRLVKEEGGYVCDPLHLGSIPIVVTISPKAFDYVVQLATKMRDLKRALFEHQCRCKHPVFARGRQVSLFTEETTEEPVGLMGMHAPPEGGEDQEGFLSKEDPELRASVIDVLQKTCVTQFLLDDFVYTLYGFSLEDQDMVERDLNIHPPAYVREQIDAGVISRLEGQASSVGSGTIPFALPDYVERPPGSLPPSMPGSPSGRRASVPPSPQRFMEMQQAQT